MSLPKTIRTQVAIVGGRTRRSAARAPASASCGLLPEGCPRAPLMEDAAIERAIARQAEIGLRSATDGEFQRAIWHFDFLEYLDGVESFPSDHGIAFKGGIETKTKGRRVVERLGSSGHPMVEHFRFLG